ncbi:MAG: hypothetical protein ABI231_01570 [Candidatus Tumulicola sp.]
MAASGGAAYASAVQFVKNPANPHMPPVLKRLDTGPSQFQFIPNSNGTGTAFTVIFDRSLFNTSSMPLSKGWLFNAFSLQPNRLADSMGRCADCFRSPTLRVDTAFDRTIDSEINSRKIAPAARIVSIEFDNNP